MLVQRALHGRVLVPQELVAALPFMGMPFQFVAWVGWSRKGWGV